MSSTLPLSMCASCGRHTPHVGFRCATCQTVSADAVAPYPQKRCTNAACDLQVPEDCDSCVFCNQLFNQRGISKKTVDMAAHVQLDMAKARTVCSLFPSATLFDIALTWDAIVKTLSTVKLCHDRKLAKPYLNATGPLFDHLGLHVSKRNANTITLARLWLKNLWMAYTETGKAKQSALRDSRKEMVMEKIGALIVGKLVVDRHLHKVTDEDCLLNASQFHDSMLQKGVIKLKKRMAMPVRVLQVSRPDATTRAKIHAQAHADDDNDEEGEEDDDDYSGRALTFEQMQ